MTILTSIAERAAGLAIPLWAPWAAGALVVVALAGGSYGLGRVQEARIGAAELADYKGKQGAQTVRIEKGETQVVIKTEIRWRDRIQKIYVQGAAIETHITDYIQPTDDARFGVNAGFMRVLAAGWAGEPAGPATDLDREPADVPLSEIAGAEVDNATSCLVWRAQALGWRKFYADQQVAINGKAGQWFVPPPAE